MRILFIWSILFIALPVFSQIERSSRNSISIIQLEYGDNYASDLDQIFNRMKLEDRYDVNNIPTKHIYAGNKRTYINKNENREAPDRSKQLTSYLNTHNIGLEIIAYLFNRNPINGYMNVNLLHKRGAYNTSDEDILESLATKRGIERIKESGFNLIDNSYIFVFDFANIQYKYEKNSAKDEGDYYWSMTPAAYLFKIEWNENLQEKLYDCWIDNDTPTEQIKEKIQAFKQIKVPVRFMSRKVYYSSRVSTGIAEQNRKVANGDKRKYSNEQLKENAFIKMVFNAADNLGELLANKHDEFHITNSLYSIHPPRAKIGKKESVNTNDLYYVYENILREDGNYKLSRRGVIRATKHIIDNRSVATGNSGTTEFYQIAGGHLEEGMAIKEIHNICASFDVGYHYGELEGIHAGFSMFFYSSRVMNHNITLDATVWDKAATVSLNYGFGPRFNNIELYPYIGIGIDDFFTNEEEKEQGLKKNISCLVKGGGRINLNLYYPIQLFIGAEYVYPFEQNDEYKQMVILKERDIQGFNIYGGARVCF